MVIKTTILALAFVLLTPDSPPAGIGRGAAEVPTVGFCDLVKNPKEYDGKVVRLRANYYSNFESSVLYDRSCAGESNWIYPELKCATDESCEPLKDMIKRHITGDPFTGMRTELVMVGEFKDSGESSRNYGPLEGLRFGFLIQRIEESFPVSPDAGWPSDK